MYFWPYRRSDGSSGMQHIMSLGDINDDSSIDNACIVYNKVNGGSPRGKIDQGIG